jgi:hypothetical protein
MTAIVTVVSILGGLVLILTVLFGIVVFGIRHEPTDTELSRKAPSLASYLARRLLGVGVRRPDDTAGQEREDCLAGTTSADPWGMGR